LNKDVYNGEWKNSKEDGKGNTPRNELGVLYYAKGGSYAGEWKNGKKINRVHLEFDSRHA